MRQRRGDVLFAALAATFVIAALAGPAAALEIKRSVLSDGAVLLVSEQHQLPMVTMTIAFDAGSRRDPDGKAGLASLTAASLTLGTKDLSAEQFNQKVDFMGSSIAVGAGADYAQASFTSLAKYEDETLRLMAATLTEPALSDAEISRKRDERLADIKAEEEQPSYVAGVTFHKVLYGNHPYGHPSEGTSESVAKLTPQDVRAFYHAQYKIGSAVIAVVGDVKADDVKAKLEKAFDALKGTVPAQAEPPAPVSGFDAGKFPGSFAVDTQTKNKSTNEALELIIEQLRDMQEQPVSDTELASAKKYLIGSFPLKIDRQSSIASFMLQVEMYGLGLDYAERYPKLIGAVTRDDVQRVAKQYLHPDALDLVAVANQTEAAINVANLKRVAEGAPASAPVSDAPAATQATQPAPGG